MKRKTIIAGLLGLLVPVMGHAQAGFYGDEMDVTGSTINVQGDVNVTATDLDVRDLTFATDKVDASGSTLGANSGVDIGDVDVLSLPALPAGSNNIGDVDVLSLPAIPAGTNAIGNVQLIDSGSHELDVQADGSVNVNVLGTASSDVTGSTVNAVMTDGAGNIIDSSATSSGHRAIVVRDVSSPDLSGMAFGQTSCEDVAAAGTCVFAGYVENVRLIAESATCTYDVDGATYTMKKNRFEDIPMKFRQLGTTVTVSSKGASATCTVRIHGVQ